MDAYYKCLRGDSANLALAEPGSFVVRDARGRDWFCYPLSREDVERLTLRDHLLDIQRADAVLVKHGLADAGTEVRVYSCPDDDELRERLAEDPPQGG